MLAVFLILFSKKDRAGNDLIYQALHQLFSKIKELVREPTLRHLFLVKPSTCSKHLKNLEPEVATKSKNYLEPNTPRYPVHQGGTILSQII
jgi:hypothetical protein